MNQGGKRKGAGAKNKNKTGKPVTFNCWPSNYDKVQAMRNNSQLSKRLNKFLKGAKL